MFNVLKSMFAKNHEDLNGQDFKQQFGNTPGGVLLDVRTPSEFASGSIKGAKNLDYLSPSFGEKAALLDKQKTYFLFCRSGARSGQACNLMAGMGFKVFNLAGGLGAWPS